MSSLPTARGLDLRNIRSPIIVFCSKADNITPPQQALGWILDLYKSVDEIRAHGQTIVYSVHETIGHLGIFVSGSVAKKEHDEFANNIDLIDVLPPRPLRGGDDAEGRRRSGCRILSPATISCASRRGRSTTSACSAAIARRTTGALPRQRGYRRSISGSIAPSCSPGCAASPITVGGVDAQDASAAVAVRSVLH